MWGLHHIDINWDNIVSNWTNQGSHEGRLLKRSANMVKRNPLLDLKADHHHVHGLLSGVEAIIQFTFVTVTKLFLCICTILNIFIRIVLNTFYYKYCTTFKDASVTE